MKTKTYKIIIAAFSFAFFSIKSSAQTSVVKDAKGETSLNLGDRGVVALNTKDESLSFSYGGLLWDKQSAKDRRLTYLGAAAKGKAKSGVTNFIKSEDVQWDGSLGAFIFSTKTYQTPTRLNRADHFFIGADYMRSQFKLFDAARPFKEQVFGKGVGGYKLYLGFNQENVLKKVPYLFGVSLSGGQSNNTADLKTMEVSTTTTYVEPLTGAIRTVERDQETAYDLTQYKKSLKNLNLNLDFGPQIAKRFLLLMHPRYSVQQDRKPQWNPAAGFYLSKDGAPLEVVAGIQVQVQDWSNNAASTKSRGERTLLNLVAGFTF